MTITYCLRPLVVSRGLMMSDDTRIVRLEREIHRLRNSPSLRLGSHLTDSIRKPWRAPFLIISLPWIMMMIGLEILGLKEQPPAFATKDTGRIVSKGDCVVMFPTNGVGFRTKFASYYSLQRGCK